MDVGGYVGGEVEVRRGGVREVGADVEVSEHLGEGPGGGRGEGEGEVLVVVVGGWG